MVLEPLKLTMVERLHAQNMYLCVRVDGEDESGQPQYAYFGIFLHEFQKLVQHLQTSEAMNPKDYRGIVLARSCGDPTPELRAFMRRKFSFADEVGEQAAILEVSRCMASLR